MAGLILACRRDSSERGPSADDLRRLALRLSPDNITPHPPEMIVEGGLIRATVNPVPGVHGTRSAVCLGAVFGDGDWSTMSSSAPDGSFAIARHDERSVELLSDAFASRTLWYALTDVAFYASTSQRALVSLLGSFELCPETVSWMISSGYLGPEHGWDKRLRRVPVGTRLTLNRQTWTASSEQQAVQYRPVDLAPREHIRSLREAVFAACEDVDLSGRSWVLPLSGGHDSRALLVGLLEANRRPVCITWGLESSLSEPGNDAYVARQLAEHFGLDHRYFALDFPDEPMREVFTRFLIAGEGRAEDFSGYTDGLAMWRDLFESGTDTVIRGDTPGLGSGQGAAYDPVSEFAARSMLMRATLIEDYPETHLIRRLGLAGQALPTELRLQPGETLDMYRDRLHNCYKVPVMFAALNDPKCAYSEVVNPLLHRRVVDAVGALPDELRMWERGYAAMVSELVPGIPFDSAHAEAQASEYTSHPRVVAEMLAELSSAEARKVLSGGALQLLIEELQRPARAATALSSLRRRAKTALPYTVVKMLRRSPQWHLGARRLAFRAYIAARMAAILEDDARALTRTGARPSSREGTEPAD